MSRIEDDLRRLVRQALEAESGLALQAVRRLEDEVAWLRTKNVVAARREGHSWAAIGRFLGISRQAARQAYAQLALDALMVPASRPNGRDEHRERIARLLADVRREVTADEDEVVAW